MYFGKVMKMSVRNVGLEPIMMAPSVTFLCLIFMVGINIMILVK